VVIGRGSPLSARPGRLKGASAKRSGRRYSIHGIERSDLARMDFDDADGAQEEQEFYLKVVPDSLEVHRVKSLCYELVGWTACC